MNATTTSLHTLLLLSDSALPLGSFAFSSGLESFLAHTKPPHTTKLTTFDNFLSHSLSNVSSTALPYVLSAYNSPSSLEDLDNDFDASTPCTVARRASISQGRALLAIWERALSTSTTSTAQARAAAKELTAFATLIKTNHPPTNATKPVNLSLNAHFPPLFGTTCSALGLSADETAYLFLLNHAKALLSAAVRASVMGPYQSQATLASGRLQGWIRGCIERETGGGGKKVEDAAVTVPTMDLWMGRHELLYSRIFNS